MNLSADTVVGLLTLLGLMYLAWVQLDLRRSETGANEAEAMESRAGAVSQMTLALMNAVEAVGNRDALIAEQFVDAVINWLLHSPETGEIYFDGEYEDFWVDLVNDVIQPIIQQQLQ